ncbi:hypothetical protein HYV30_02785 [Candidatus Kaiserbacteria bacterium]|nr:hypothetical protein [Candidatus Kaiserbacteria bacterium]
MKRGNKKPSPKNAPSKDMSVSELAGMVARGFAEVSQDFKDVRREMDEGFARVDGRVNILEHKVDRIQDSVNELTYDSRKTRTRLENLELKVFGSIQEP